MFPQSRLDLYLHFKYFFVLKGLRKKFTYYSTGIYPFPKQAMVFMCLLYKSFQNAVGKGEIAYDKQFLLFPQCFLPSLRST